MESCHQTIPADDPTPKLAVASPDHAKGRHVSVAGGTYTVLLSGEETGRRYCLIDMRVPMAADHRRIDTISRKCLQSLTANSN